MNIMLILCCALYLGLLAARGLTGRVREQPSLFALTASLCAAFIGGGFSLGNAGAAFEGGLKNSFLLCGFAAGLLLTGAVYAPGFAAFRGERTAGGIMGRVCGSRARRFTGLLAVVFCTGVLGAQISAFGAVASYVFSAPKSLCSAIGFSLVILFCAVGGPAALRRSDSIQVPVLLFGVSLTFILALSGAGGARLLRIGMYGDISGEILSPEGLSSFFVFMTGELLCPPMAERLLSCGNTKKLRAACFISAALSVPLFFMTGLVGIFSREYSLCALSEHAMPASLRFLVPFPLWPFLLSALLCVYLTSGGAFLSACSGSLSRDVLAGSKAPERATTLACGFAALLISLAFDGVLSILILAYCFWCPVMLVPLSAALAGKRFGEKTFFAGAICAITVILAWRLLGEPLGISPILAGLAANAAVFGFSTLKRRHK